MCGRSSTGEEQAQYSQWRDEPSTNFYSSTRSLKYVPTAVLSRQTAGLRGRTLIINLPGKPKSIRETFDEAGAGCSGCRCWPLAPASILLLPPLFCRCLRGSLISRQDRAIP